MATSSQIKKLKDKSFILTITVPQERVRDEYQHVLQSAQKDFEIKGFRKGKAPLEVVENNLSKDRLMEELINHLLSHIYSDEVKKNELKPIIEPKVRFINPPVALDKDWEVEFTSTELPVIELSSKYKDAIKKLATKKTESKEKKALGDNEKIDQIFEVLLKNSKVELPEILIEAGVDSRLSQLVEQTNQAGITVQQYLQNKKTNLDQYKEDLKKDIQKEWNLNLAINKIAQEEKLEVTQDELKDQLQKNPQLANNINLLYYLLEQQKVVNFLTSLASK